MLKFILIILDGFGLRSERDGNAYALAHTPNLDRMLEQCPMVPLETSGKHVGLPDGIMGNSEVGHMNIGAGRIVKQDLVRINRDIINDSLRNNPELQRIFSRLKKNCKTLHLMGLISDGGVHSHIEHVYYLLQAAKDFGLSKLAIHVITDGRDTSPFSGINFIKELEAKIKSIGIGSIATVSGRYYIMDRDNRWDRVELAYNALVHGKGETFTNAGDAMQASYKSNITDEFVRPKIIGDPKLIEDGDSVFTFNLRADRMRQISRAFTEIGFCEFPALPLKVNYVSMTKYKDDFLFPTLYEPIKLNEIFPEILSRNGYKQLRIAETEKYAHVTYFFNGGDENVFPGEERKMIPSPKIATYDLQPEMSAINLTEVVLDAVNSDMYDAIIVNFANPDIVGHTGKLNAAMEAIEVVDDCVGKISITVKARSGAVFLTADHGNLEMMIDPDTGHPHTNHTTLPVPFVLDTTDNSLTLEGNGKLADIAPTILDYLCIDKPDVMNGNSLLKR